MTARCPAATTCWSMLAGYGDRQPGEVGEELGSLELTWLITQAEQRYSVLLDLSDETFAAHVHRDRGGRRAADRDREQRA